MKKTSLLTSLALAAAVGAVGAASALPVTRISAKAVVAVSQASAVTIAGAERRTVLRAASRALNARTTLEGRFLQVAADGSAAQGRFWLQRPGRLRFEYDAPSPLTVVSDGETVAIQDRALKTVDRAPLRSTPLFFVLKRDIDLERDVHVTRVSREGGAVSITARDRAGKTDGEITLVFDGPNYDLKRWRIVDGQGAATDLALQQTRVVPRIDPALFVAPQSVNVTRPRANR